MPLVTSKGLLEKALQEGYAIGAFNANNLEMVQAIVETAEEERSPVIVQISQGAIKYGGADYFAAIVKVAAEKATVPVVLHLDHGMDLTTNVLCLREGYTSLMIDGSKLSFEENIALTRQVVEIAHKVGIPVEGEIGTVPYTKGKQFPTKNCASISPNPRRPWSFTKDRCRFPGRFRGQCPQDEGKEAILILSALPPSGSGAIPWSSTGPRGSG